MEKKYILDGYVIATDWFGMPGYVRVRITTDERGYKEIKENPLQDFIAFGVQSVDYAFFEVYLTEIEHTDKYTVEKRYHEAIEVIEAGNADAVNEFGEDFPAEIWLHEPAKVSY